MDLQGIAKIGEKTADVADNKISVADEVKTEVGKAATLNPSIPNTPVKPSVVASSASKVAVTPNASHDALVDPYAFPQDEKPSAGEILSNTSSPSVSNNPLDVKKPPDDKKEPSAQFSASISLKPAPLSTLSQIKLTEDFERTTTPLGSPITPDVADIYQPALVRNLESSPSSVDGRPKKPRLSRASNVSSSNSATKRKPSREHPAPGSPQTVVSERQQLALLRKEALESEKRSSPALDTSFPRPDRSSTPSSTSSAKESREARNVNRRDGKGETPLHIACKKGDLEAVKKLLEDGGDLNAADNAGWTPLHEAANHGREDVCRFLIAAGADLNAKGLHDVTALMDAVQNGHINIVRELLTAGANSMVENKDGDNCLKLAQGVTRNQPELSELLRSFLKPHTSTSTSKPEVAPAKRKDGMSTSGKEANSPKKRPRGTSESDQGKKDAKDKEKRKLVENREKDKDQSGLVEKKKKEKNIESQEKEKEKGKKDVPRDAKQEEKKLTTAAPLNSPSMSSFSPGMPAVFVGRNTLVLRPAEPVVEKEKEKDKVTSQYEDISDDEEAKPTGILSFPSTQPPQVSLPSTVSPSISAVKESQPSVSAISTTTTETAPARRKVLSNMSTVPEKVDTVAGMVKASSAKLPSTERAGATKDGDEAKVAKGKEEKGSLAIADVPIKEASVLPSTETVPPVLSNELPQTKSSESSEVSKDKVEPGTAKKDNEIKETEKVELDQMTGKEKEIDTPINSSIKGNNSSETSNTLPPILPAALSVSAVPAPVHTSTIAAADSSNSTTDQAEKKPDMLATFKTISQGSLVSSSLPTPKNPTVPITSQPQTSLLPPTHTASTTPITEKPAVVTSAIHEVPPLQAQTSTTEKSCVLPTTPSLKDALSAPVSSSFALTASTNPPSASSSTVSLSSVSNPSTFPSLSGSTVTTTSMTLPVTVSSASFIGAHTSVNNSVSAPLSGVSTTVYPTAVVASISSIFNVASTSGVMAIASTSLPGTVSASASGVVGKLSGGPLTSIVRMPNMPASGFVSAMSTSGTKVLFGVSTDKKQEKKMEKLKNKEGKDGKEKVKKTKETRESVETGKMESQPGTSSANVGEKEGELSQAKVKVESPGGKKRSESTTKKERSEKPEKRLTRAQRAQAAAASGQPVTPTRRKNAKEDKDKPTRGRSKRAAAELDVPPGAVIDTAELKQKRPRASPKKQLAVEAVKSPVKKEEPVVVKKETPQPESPSKMSVPVDVSVGSSSSEPVNRLPFKKRLTIRNEIEEFINQRRQVEENWKKCSNTFAMKVFPKNCNDYLILRQNYSIDSSMPMKREAPPVLPLALKTCFGEQEEERRILMRSHLMERDRLIMGAEQEMWRLHQRFGRISAGIPIPFSACMIMSEQESNKSFQTQEQADQAKTAAAKSRVSMRDLIKWLEDSDDKFDCAKTEMLTRQRLEAQMLHSKQRMYWAWRQEDLGMHDPSCRHPEDLHNPYVPQVVVEDFVMLPDA